LVHLPSEGLVAAHEILVIALSVILYMNFLKSGILKLVTEDEKEEKKLRYFTFMKFPKNFRLFSIL